jgi:hypothetical protein
MKINRFLLILILLQIISCDSLEYGPAYVIITNNNEHNITSVTIGDVKRNFVIVDEKANDLIAKGGNSKTFEVSGEEIPGDFIVCIEAEDTPERMCSVTFYLDESYKIFFTWGGDKSSKWQ